jgi:hypothetical protein
MVESLSLHEHNLLVTSGLSFPHLNREIAQERGTHIGSIRLSPWSLLSFLVFSAKFLKMHLQGRNQIPNQKSLTTH